MLLQNYSNTQFECGTDEVGRGCISGPVVAAAVIFDPSYQNHDIKDSKQLSEKKRNELYDIIINNSISYSIQEVSATVIDKINILNASIEAMHISISKLSPSPTFILADGNQFKNYPNIEHQCVIKGDSKYLSIAAASILAKVYRDRLMKKLHEDFPMYKWKSNKGYPTKAHKLAVKEYGLTKWHRKTFKST